jgi:hypothetical protein
MAASEEALQAGANAELSKLCKQWKRSIQRGRSDSSSEVDSGSDSEPGGGLTEDATAIRMRSLAPLNAAAAATTTATAAADTRRKTSDRRDSHSANGTRGRAPSSFDHLRPSAAERGRKPQQQQQQEKKNPSTLSRVSKPRSVWSRVQSFFRRHTPRWVYEFPMLETQLLTNSFGTMLEALYVNHLNLQTANESKKRFIRYIFHEVRHKTSTHTHTGEWTEEGHRELGQRRQTHSILTFVCSLFVFSHPYFFA